MFDRLRERRLTAAEREEARDKRRADRASRREARNEQSAERRAAGLEAEARRHSNSFGPAAVWVAAISAVAADVLS
jgi:predicted nucleic acid-binding protein